MAGKNPGMVIRIAASTAELKRNLAQARNQIEVTTAGMSKLAKSLDGEKLSQRAHNIVAAVDKIGGVTKLTNAEKARLNRTLSATVQKYAAMGKTAPAAMVALEKATRRVSTPTSALTTRMVALGAAVGSALGIIAVNALRRMSQWLGSMAANAGKLSAISAGFDRLTSAMGESGDVMMGTMRSATKGLVSDLDLMQSANKAILLGLPVTSQEMGTLSKAAVTLGRVMGQGATQSLDDLIKALGRSSPLILDNLGLTVKVGQANKIYAERLGKSVSALSDVEKKMAFYNAAMEAAATKTDELGEIQLTAMDQLKRLSTTIGNYVTDAAAGVNESDAFAGAIGWIADAAARAAANMDLLAQAQERVGPDLPMNIGASVPNFAGDPAIEQAIVDILRERAAEASSLALPTTAMSQENAAAAAAITKESEALAKALTASAEAAKKLKQEHDALISWAMNEQGLAQMAADAQLLGDNTGTLTTMMAHHVLVTRDQRIALVESGLELRNTEAGARVLVAGLVKHNTVLDEFNGLVAPKAVTMLGRIKGSLGGLLEGLTGGGGIAGALSKLGTGIMEGFGNIISGGMTSLINTGIGLLGQGLGKLFGFGGEGKKTNRERDSMLAKMFGTQDEFRRLAAAAGVADAAIRKVFTADTVEGFKSALSAVTDQMDEHKVAMEEAAAVVEAGFARMANAVNARATVVIDVMQRMKETMENEEWAAAVQGQQAAVDRLGVFAAAAFSELIRNGSTALEALKALEPTFDALAQGMEEFGLQGTETINKLLGIRKLTQEYEDQFAALDALSQIMSAFGDAGVMNLELMQTVAADVGDQFRQIAASGEDINAAMALQQPLLQQLWEAQEKYGAITDETTARLLAQAEEQGLVGAHMKDVNERILDVLIAIADVFGAVLPASMREFGGEGERQAERVGSAIDAIPDSKNVTISISQSGSVELPGGGGGSDIDYGESRHMGGIVGSARRAHSGLFVIPGGLARDEVPVVAQTGEAFLSRKAVASIGGAAGVNALNDGRGSSGAAGSSDVVSAIRVLQADQRRTQAELVRLLRTLPTVARDAALLARGRSVA